MKDEKNPEKANEILEAKQKELRKMMKEVFPNTEEEETKTATEEIAKIAKWQNQVDLYAYEHQHEIERLKEQIEELRTKEKTEENREELLQKIESLETRYKVYGRYIKDEEWENLYRTKFDILMSDINKRQESPLLEADETAYEKEIPTYSKIIEEKIEAIITGRNPELKRAFGEKAPEAVEIIKRILQGNEKEYNTYQILQDKNLLRLLLAFDVEYGLEKMTLNKREVQIKFNESMFGWEEVIPLKSIYHITHDKATWYYDNANLDNNQYIALYSIYKEKRLEKPEHSFNEYSWSIHDIPEGIIEIKPKNKWNKIQLEKEELFRRCGYDVLIFPSTLRKIGYGLLNDSNRKNIVFNEGLEEIGEGSFKGCPYLGSYTNLMMPKSLKKIGKQAFYMCCNMTPVILNEGLQEIGYLAFYNKEPPYEELFFRPSTLIILPSTLKSVGESIINKSIVTNIGLKNYKGQKIPVELWRVWGGYPVSIYFFEGNSLEPYLTLGGDFPKPSVDLRDLYEFRMQEMSKTNPEIKRIWKEYLKRRDSNETDIKQEVNDSKQEER